MKGGKPKNPEKTLEARMRAKNKLNSLKDARCKVRTQATLAPNLYPVPGC